MTSKTVYVLRTCNANLTSYNGFRWPASGRVTAPDWKPVNNCGSGLHGLLWGEGDGSHLSLVADARWLVVGVAEDSLIDLYGKVKWCSVATAKVLLRTLSSAALIRQKCVTTACMWVMEKLLPQGIMAPLSPVFMAPLS